MKNGRRLIDCEYAKTITSDYTASYARYVATSRAVPSLEDGLKPVQRRCINSAYDLRLYHDKKFLKVAKLEGQVMGDYHPHGGASMIILAQPFKTRYPLFEGQGNFGSADDPNSVAASRYIETRMTKFCEDFYLSSADYADRTDNYDGRLKEIVRYYPPIPGVLLTGASGIAVGISTSIPTHRISDVCRSLLAYMKNPEDSKYLNTMMPETCEESIILTSSADIKKMYMAGEGSIRYKAKTHYETLDGKLALVVDAFPPDYSKKRLETAAILEAVENDNLELRNESAVDVRYVFLSQDKSVLDAVEERLVNSVGYRFYIEHDDQIHMYKLSELYDEFIKCREGYIVRKYTSLVAKHEDEINFINTMLAFKADRDYIKSMFDLSTKEVVAHIIKKFNATESIATRIVGSTLSSLMLDNSAKLKAKATELIKLTEEYKRYIEDPRVKVVLDVKELYAQYKNEERRAIHHTKVSEDLVIKYRGINLEILPSVSYYLGTPDNNYSLVSGATILTTPDIDNYMIVSTEYDYYVLYDERGLVAVTSATMSSLSNKFKSDHLVDIIGTNNLESLQIVKYPKQKKSALGDWAIRQRLSYIAMVDEPMTIKITSK